MHAWGEALREVTSAQLARRALRRVGVDRRRVATARLWCERVMFAGLARPRGARGRILCYHGVGTPTWGVNDVSLTRFARQLEVALRAGYRFVAPERIARDGGQPRELAITFDDGLASVARSAAPILAAYGIPWTIFVVTDWADGRHSFGDDVILRWSEIERLAGAGVGIGSHSASHPDFSRLGRDAMARELCDSRRAIEARTGVRPTAFAIPMGRSCDWTLEADALARSVGYDLIYAQAEHRRPWGTVGRTFVSRFDGDWIFRAALEGAFDAWEEWV